MKCPDCGKELCETETSYDCVNCGYFEVKEPYKTLSKQNQDFLNKIRLGYSIDDEDDFGNENDFDDEDD